MGSHWGRSPADEGPAFVQVRANSPYITYFYVIYGELELFRTIWEGRSPSTGGKIRDRGRVDRRSARQLKIRVRRCVPRVPNGPQGVPSFGAVGRISGCRGSLGRRSYVREGLRSEGGQGWRGGRSAACMGGSSVAFVRKGNVKKTVIVEAFGQNVCIITVGPGESKALGLSDTNVVLCQPTSNDVLMCGLCRCAVVRKALVLGRTILKGGAYG